MDDVDELLCIAAQLSHDRGGRVIRWRNSLQNVQAGVEHRSSAQKPDSANSRVIGIRHRFKQLTGGDLGQDIDEDGNDADHDNGGARCRDSDADDS